MFDANPRYHFESDLDHEDPQHVLLETRLVDLSTVTISQDEDGLLVVTRNVEAAEVADDDDDETPVPQRQLKYRLEPEGDLFRIVALRNISRFYVDAGEQGGLVSSPNILAQTGDCWIGYGSKVTGNVYVTEDAYIHGDSSVLAGGHIRVEGCANVSDSTLEGNLAVSGGARLSNCKIAARGNSFLHLHGVASFDESRIELASGQVLHIPGGCVAGAHIRNRFELVSFYTGQRFGWLDAFRGKDGDQRFTIGCQNFDDADDLRSLGYDYSITDVERKMLEAFIALADAAKKGWELDETPTKSGDAEEAAVAPATGGPVTSALLSQYGEDLSRDTTF